ncbi:MAG: Hpt domain-containing protein [Gammaproteobacteria bacterium]|nr:Hpt domain-containing protein [Gammaproteobacteria bacterium]
MHRSRSFGRAPLLTVGVGLALALSLGVVLLAGFRLATELNGSVVALQTASSLQTYPADISREIDTLRERLEVRTYAGRALDDLRGTTTRLDDGLADLARASAADPVALRAARDSWARFHRELDPVLAFSGQPYRDSDTAGSVLSTAGRAHFMHVRRAQLYAARHAQALREELGKVVDGLRSSASTAALRLRGLLLGGVLAALMLALLAVHLQIAKGREERSAREAQERTRDILRTVREGFFLLDSGHRIGPVWSDALRRMFGREDFAGLSFQDLLQDLVPPATLATALKYVNLLWGDRAHENLMKSINPLAQLEITTESERGGKETRYLQFDFHRVMGPKGVQHVLCAVGDITSSVLLARELQDSQSHASAQLDLLIGLTRTDPLQLGSFLDTADAGLRLVNAIMKEPARGDGEFRRKIDGLMRELHSLKGEAAALELTSVAERLHALEGLVEACASKAELSGADFLPVVLKLDELLAHLQGVKEIAGRLMLTREPQPLGESGSIGAALESLAAQLSREHGKPIRLELAGLAQVPAAYARTVKDCLIQLLRNAAVHGIEPTDQRAARGKNGTGLISAKFAATPNGYELVFEDDGAGIAADTLKRAAVRRQLISEEEAAAMDTRAAMALMFRPGLSTADGVSMDAGRGVGMDVVARGLQSIGGRIGVATHPGRFTRFRITLPAADRATGAVA